MIITTTGEVCRKGINKWIEYTADHSRERVPISVKISRATVIMIDIIIAMFVKTANMLMTHSMKDSYMHPI